MSDEKTGNQTEATEQSTDGLSPSEIRNHDFFKNVVREKDTKLNQALEELSQLRNQQEEEARQKELKEKEAAGEYEQITAQLKAEKESLQQKYDSDVRTLKLENALTREGADEYFTSWAIQNFQGNNIEEYVEALKSDEKHSQRFALNQMVEPGNPPPTAAVPASRSPGNWSQVKQDLRSKDPATRENADTMIRSYMEKHNKLPW